MQRQLGYLNLQSIVLHQNGFAKPVLSSKQLLQCHLRTFSPITNRLQIFKENNHLGKLEVVVKHRESGKYLRQAF